ncbi:MAG: 3-deoxy-7-phosphoheptulonate synthase [Gammaproteobacteria bacterium]|nr:3-deoxy-7-phosphoheptulonate synthase [Gammaproteobacteria bacterium]
MSQSWTTTSWLKYKNLQAPVYKDKALLTTVLTKLSQKPPLVSVAPIVALKQTLAEASLGRAFILQGGDCAESFQDCRPKSIRAQLNLMHKMAHIIQPSIKKPIVPIGRIAGQYAKPRSFEYETQGDITLPSYRGDLINASPFTINAREPNPSLLLKGYASAAHKLRFIKAMQKKQAFYTSHEALHLHYEAALTRQSKNGLWYNLSTHLPWVGVRTTQLDGAHIEFLRGIENPVGIKIGPNTTPDTLLKLIRTLNPKQEAGRILLITRLGAKHITDVLPQLIETVQTHALPVTWSCDPMHGNTETTKSGIKTRHIDNIWHELEQALTIHQKQQSHLGGVHLEITPEPVTECLGGTGGPTEADLETAYKSLLDPRLNQTQALEIATNFGKAYQS